MKREKRLEKGIESLKKQKEIHKEKMEKASSEKNYERVAYYEKEIGAFEIKIEDKHNKLHRKNKGDKK